MSEAPNAVNAMKNWQSLVDKERLTSELWNENWGSVFFENGAPTAEEKIEQLEKRIQELKEKEKEIDKDKDKIPLETFTSPYYKKKGKDLMPAWPHGNH